MDDLTIDLPVDAIGGVIGVLTNAPATIVEIAGEGSTCKLSCVIPTVELRMIQQQLPRLTGGEGSWMVTHAGHQPVDSIESERKRIGPNPLVRDGCLGDVVRL